MAIGYGWFLRELGGQQVRYFWGYGGQSLHVVPTFRPRPGTATGRMAYWSPSWRVPHVD